MVTHSRILTPALLLSVALFFGNRAIQAADDGYLLYDGGTIVETGTSPTSPPHFVASTAGDDYLMSDDGLTTPSPSDRSGSPMFSASTTGDDYLAQDDGSTGGTVRRAVSSQRDMPSDRDAEVSSVQPHQP